MRPPLLVLPALLLLARPAVADPYHGNVALLGARASGLGGAAAGLPEEDAAPYYNPAAVALDPRLQISFSAQALQLRDRSFTPYLGSRATESSVRLVPNASIGSFPWRGGRASFSVFVTEDETLNLNQQFTPPPSTGVATARIRRFESASTYELGPSYGRAITDILSVGISALYVYRSVAQRAEEYAEPTDPNATPAAISHSLDAEAVSQGLTIVGGLRVQPGGPAGRFTLGLSLRSGVSLDEQAVQHEERFLGTRAADGSLTFVREPTERSTSGRGGLPASVTVGGSAKLGPALFAAQSTLTSAQDGLAPGVDGRLTLDGAVGAELEVDAGWTTRAGLFTRRSSVRDPNAAPRINQYGASLGVGHAELYHVTDFALVVVDETGQAPVATVTGGTELANVSGFELMLTLGGAFRF